MLIYLLVHHKSTINVPFSIFYLFKSNWFMALLKMVIFHSYVSLPVPSGNPWWKIHHFQPRQETTSGLSSDGRTWCTPGHVAARQRKTMGKCWEMCGQMCGQMMGKWWENDDFVENMWLENDQFMISGVKSKHMGYTKCSKKPDGRNRGKKQAPTRPTGCLEMTG